MKSFHVEVRHEKAGVVIAVRGELDMKTAPLLGEQFASLDAKPRRVIVDLRDLKFMDSTGLSTIVEAHQRLDRQGCRLSLVGASWQVARLLHITGVNRWVHVARTLEELLDAR